MTDTFDTTTVFNYGEPVLHRLHITQNKEHLVSDSVLWQISGGNEGPIGFLRYQYSHDLALKNEEIFRVYLQDPYTFGINVGISWLIENGTKVHIGGITVPLIPLLVEAEEGDPNLKRRWAIDEEFDHLSVSWSIKDEKPFQEMKFPLWLSSPQLWIDRIRSITSDLTEDPEQPWQNWMAELGVSFSITPRKR